MSKPAAACSAAMIFLLGTLSLGCNPCTTTQRELRVSNNSSQSIFVGGGGGALRALCVTDATHNCLTSDLNDPTPGKCKCGSTAGTLACPGTSVPTADGKNCTCSGGLTCGPTAACGTSNTECYFVLPDPTELTGFVPTAPWNWQLPSGGTAEFCLNPASATWKSSPSAAPTQVPAAVWWSGGVFARTGCQSNGANCLAGNCPGVAPNSNCPAGVGGQNPATIAEFTLQRQATDFYDITVLNGANIAEQMAPIPTPTIATPAGISANYWCKIPGSGCNWNFGKYIAAVPLSPTPSATLAASRVDAPAGATTDYTSLLMLSTQQCSTASGGAKCPSGFTCSGAPGACFKPCSTDANCPSNLHCLPGGNGINYCQCRQESDCSQQAGHRFCGTQFIPGLGPNEVYLQQCGDFGGWWSGDDFCGNPNNVVGPFNCGQSITDGDGNLTNIASSSAATAPAAATRLTQPPATMPTPAQPPAAAAARPTTGRRRSTNSRAIRSPRCGRPPPVVAQTTIRCGPPRSSPGWRISSRPAPKHTVIPMTISPAPSSVRPRARPICSDTRSPSATWSNPRRPRRQCPHRRPEAALISP